MKFEALNENNENPREASKKREPKKYLIILILRILETDSDKRHPLTQLEIADKISACHPCDRKTVGRNIKFLREVGFPIIKTRVGFYMDNCMFSRDEVDFVLRAVQAVEAPAGVDVKNLCERLRSGLSRYYNERE